MDIDSAWVLLIPVVLILAAALQILALYWLARVAISGVRRFVSRRAS